MSSAVEFIIAVCAPIATAGVLGVVGYARAISRRLHTYENQQFRDELHLLDHEQRLDALGSRRAS